MAVLVEVFLFDIIVIHFAKAPTSDPVYITVICLISIMYSVAILFIQFNFVLQKDLETELAIIHQLLQKERFQYKISKDTIDIINMKCHDMKQQIHTIGRSMTDQNVLQEMEDSIKIYDSILKTGNHALDIILTEKNLFCQKNNIEISYIVDGEALCCMSDTDIYSLIGNILDNAIEAVLQLPTGFRSVGLKIKRQSHFISISSYNYFQGAISFEQGYPVTTKEDKNNHGFGTRSMATIVDKYNGSLSFQADKDIFYVNILFSSQEA